MTSGEKAGRLALVVALIWLIVRVDFSIASMKEAFFASLFLFATVATIGITADVFERSVMRFGELWRRRLFDPCGALSFDDRPCMLPDGHRSIEHATAWNVRVHDASIEERLRWDDDTFVGRTEKRAARGALPRVNARGEVPEPAAK